MSSTYSSLKIELIGTGEQNGAWGSTTNVNLGTALEEAIVGRATVNFATDANKTIVLTNTNATQQARNFVLNLTSTGSLTATRTLFVPAINKSYLIENNTSGGQSIFVANATGTGVTVPNGRRAYVFNNGTNVLPANNVLYSPLLTGQVVNNVTAVAASDIDCSTATYFTKTVAGNTTFTFSNPPVATLGAFGFTLLLTYTSGTITWPASVYWPNNSAPSFTGGQKSLLMFVTDDAGTSWHAAALTGYVG
jgi:hypothetical protein